MSGDRVNRVIVVGAGLAGARSAAALREAGYAGELVLLGAEPHPPYDRPPLSKAGLLGGTDPVRVDDVRLDLDWAALDVELRTNCRATGLEPGRLTTEAGPERFDRLVLATGAEPVTLPGATDRVHLLRTVEDAGAIRAAVAAKSKVVVLGAGWIGAEVATAAARGGCEVTVVEAGSTPLRGALPAEVAERMVPWYAEAGVALRLDARAARVAADGVELAGGEKLESDCVVLGLGVRPSTGWLTDAPITLDGRGAVSVDAHLATSLAGVYAVGDCASFPSGRFGTRLLVAHWDNALRGPTVVAANLLGGTEIYDPVPYFWSEQFGRVVQYAGYHADADRLVWRGDPVGPRWTACWLRGDRLVALLAVDRPRDLVQGRRRIAAAAPVDPGRLADPDTTLRVA